MRPTFVPVFNLEVDFKLFGRFPKKKEGVDRIEKLGLAIHYAKNMFEGVFMDTGGYIHKGTAQDNFAKIPATMLIDAQPKTIISFYRDVQQDTNHEMRGINMYIGKNKYEFLTNDKGIYQPGMSDTMSATNLFNGWDIGQRFLRNLKTDGTIEGILEPLNHQ